MPTNFVWEQDLIEVVGATFVLETKYFGSNQQSTSLVSILILSSIYTYILTQTILRPWDIKIFSPRRYWDIEILRYSHPDDIEGEVAKGVENDHHNQHFHKLQVTTMETWIRKLMKVMLDCGQNTNLTMIMSLMLRTIKNSDIVTFCFAFNICFFLSTRSFEWT